ncbi:galactose oxidase [Setomelanomma holmii]|uniref:Galactose oxidase n=1 Tax=Setomelanomma holmii TaxID=210430 RepID=A0A9P4LNJ1_9PLEO|nr:galactose oxidase [Setomelanomma holmii]
MHFHLTILLSFLAAVTSHPHRTPTWQSLSPIPLYPRQEHTTLFLPPSAIVILGGVIPSNDTTLAIPFDTTPVMQFYSILTNTWTSRAPIPTPLNHLNAAVVHGKIYLLGGMVESGGVDYRAWRAVPDSFTYDSYTNSWTALPGLPAGQERGSAAVGVYDGKIYLAGGVTVLELYGNQTQATVSVVSIFDTMAQKWLDVPEEARYMPEDRDHAGAAVVEGKMYVLGGRNHGPLNVKDTVFVLDLCDLEAGWKVSPARLPTARGGVAAGVVRKKIYTFGGEGNPATESGVFGQVEAYDTVRSEWESVGTMRVPRHGTYAVGVRGRVYIPGGGVVQGGGPVSDFDIFIP